MMNNIGATHSELRDSLIYNTFNQLIVNKKLSTELVKRILYTALDDEHLFYGLDESNNDKVFTRTFSILLVPLALEYNESILFLSNQDFEYIYSRVSGYFALEQDLRGYIKGKGWAHSVAHTADALESLIASSYCSVDHCVEVLDLIRKKFCNCLYAFINSEDDRIAEVIVRILRRDILRKGFISDWIEQFSVLEYIGNYPEDDILRTNTKNLLRSIYFKLIIHDANLHKDVTTTIIRVMKHL
ncbi:DUF2785 domain-containing protein [Paenibacillus sp. p3-SID867]|uniref:DUF2785 domain-containing protein n=1 Tax=Paenibacillus sp. p3-SID867 TaxID=2916363 RepID=UPI0021A3F072|nr:DUF2785 domain-containing protein [Paenibacillus sp. p3-SID867]MCT1400833.1 DUF2785 domain-containing protein [Paenibacillus sp. p3-SID867]